MTKKLALVVTIAAMAALNVQAATHAKVQLWADGPYWADRNIGASAPEDYGLYFWWGDTTGTFSFNFNSDNSVVYTHGKSVAELQRAGWVTSDGVLAPAHDAAHAKWGGSWRMPTFQEFDDLCYKCDWTWTTKNGVNGYVVRGRGTYSSNSIFLPSDGVFGKYWSSVPHSDYSYWSWYLSFGSGYHVMDFCSDRCEGHPVRPVIGFGEVTDSVIQFNANGGSGTMGEQTFEEGKAQKLLKNTYLKDGYVFQGWATIENSEVVYKDEAEITATHDMTLYAVWANPALMLTAESANWSFGGSLTLRCEDADLSGAPHTYSLEYKNENGTWVAVDDAAATGIAASTDGFAHLTDGRFMSRLGGIPPVVYRVKDENERMSVSCVTRMRHGLFVAINEYQDGWQGTHDNHVHQASVFRGAYVRYGGANGYIKPLNNSDADKFTISGCLDHIAESVAQPGDVFLFYYVGHGGSHCITCYDKDKYISAAELIDKLHSLHAGVGIVVVLNTCHSASMIVKDDLEDGMGNIASLCGVFNFIVCEKGWFKGLADVYGNSTFANGDGYATFAELAAWGMGEMARNNTYYNGRMMTYYNSFVLEKIFAGKVPDQDKSNRIWTWLTSFPSLFTASGGDETLVMNITAANGCRTVGECYALGINPEDPNDDLKITAFKMKDGKPEITLNHTKDGSGNSFEDRVKILGKKELTDAEWQEVPPKGNPAHRFFKVGVEMP